MAAPRKPVEIALGMNQAALAAELATRRETLSRVLRRLRDLGLVDFAGRSRLRVPDAPALRRHFEAKTAEGT
jgi:CRP-like cAMP-binding protein